MISVVIPLHNEAESLKALHGELAAVAGSAGLDPIEFLFVDDGSRDGSWAEIQALGRLDPRVRAIRFRRNFGKAAALAAGFSAARGDLVFTLDADLQDDPAEFPRFLAKLARGFDVVSGWKKRRHDPWHKVGPSRVFNLLVSGLTGCSLHDHNCGFKLLRRAVVDEITLYGELHRFVPALAHARGFRVAEVVVHHRARQFGRSKYGFNRFLKGLLDLVTVRFLSQFGERPLHILGGLGLVLGIVGGGLLGLLLGLDLLGWLGRDDVVLAVAAGTTVLAGVGLFGLGLVAELVVSLGHQPGLNVSISEELEPDPDSSPTSERSP